jgi:two-component system OmpR family response regulator
MDTVLIVDDSSFIVEGLTAFLKKKYRTLAAYGGAECLEILKRETPSVIILDIMMEPMDGWETLARIKENPITCHIPVLMFSAKKISQKDAEEHRIRIDDFIIKPVSPKKIVDAIEKVLARHDTNRKMAETWRSAGISQEKIDKYLSLVTNIEVDISLCQNMKIQYDLIHPEEKNREEFEAAITAIEDRIRQERGLIDTLTREMNKALAQYAGGQEPAGATSPLTADGSAGLHEAAGTGSDNPPPLPPEEKHSETPAAGLAAAVLESPRSSETEPAGATATTSPPVPPLVTDQPEPDTPRTDHGLHLPESPSVPEELPAGQVPAHAETAPPEVTVIWPVLSVTDTGVTVCPLPGREPGQDDSTRATEPGPAPRSGLPVFSPGYPAHEPPVIAERNVLPANPDIFPYRSETVSPAGAGTDVPMPWDDQMSYKPQKNIPGMAGKAALSKTGTEPPVQGFFARLIALIRSLTGKRE